MANKNTLVVLALAATALVLAGLDDGGAKKAA